MSPRSTVDLHLHSTASDGRLDPPALVRHVTAQGVRLMALTDHDTLDGLEAARSEALACGIQFVPGIELSADWEGRTIHVLGLALDPAAAALRTLVQGQKQLRAERAGRIAERLTEAGLPGAEILARVRGEGPLPTRTHFARALAELGHAPDVGGAFKRWLGRGRPAAISTGWPTLAAVTAVIAAAGGAPAIAHPLRYTLSAGQLRRLCNEFRAAGGRAVEVVTGGQGPADRERAISLAVRCQLAGSVGSDFHDPAVAWNPPGRLAKLPGSVRPVWADPPFPTVAHTYETA